MSKIDLTKKDEKQIKDINEKLAREPQDFPVYDGDDVHILRYSDGKETWYMINLENVSVNIEEPTYEELTDAIAITFEKRKMVIAYLMGILVAEKGELSYSDFVKRFGTLMSLFCELPKFSKDDENYFKMIEKMQLQTVENIINLLPDNELPDFTRQELIKLAETLNIDIEQEREARKKSTQPTKDGM